MLFRSPERAPLGETVFGTGFPNLDPLLKLYPGQLVVVTGTPGCGKTSLMLNIVVNTSLQYGKRWLLYLPENWMTLKRKLAVLSGEDTEKLLKEHCFVFDEEIEGPKNLETVLNVASKAILKRGVSCVLIDPWNELEHVLDKGENVTDYVRDMLRCTKEFARMYEATVIIVAHPTKVAAERPPGLYDIEGSASWYNKADNGLVVFRDPTAPRAKVVSAKVREFEAGNLGECYFTVDRATGAFYEAMAD